MSSNKALVVIDVQNDYFPGGALPLWNVNATLHNILTVVEQAKQRDIPIILVQHVVDPSKQTSDVFNMGSYGVAIHPALLEAAPDATIVTKGSADSFRGTNLAEALAQLGSTELILCGMQTQNCVGLTGISGSAKDYKITLLADCMTAETKHVHLFALGGFGAIVPIVRSTLIFD